MFRSKYAQRQPCNANTSHIVFACVVFVYVFFSIHCFSLIRCAVFLSFLASSNSYGSFPFSCLSAPSLFQLFLLFVSRRLLLSHISCVYCGLSVCRLSVCLLACLDWIFIFTALRFGCCNPQNRPRLVASRLPFPQRPPRKTHTRKGEVSRISHVDVHAA